MLYVVYSTYKGVYILTIGQRIKQLRKEKKMTQQTLQKLSGVAQATISDYENDIITEHRAYILMRLAGALETTPEYLLSGTGEKNINDVRYMKSELIQILDQLTPEAQTAILIAAKAMIQSK